MSDAFWQHLPILVGSIGVFITSLIAAIVGIMNNRKLTVVEKATNGLGAKLAESQKQVGHAEGVIEGKQAERTRRNEME